MNSLRNKVQLIGNVGDTPKVETLESGTTVARLSIATNEYYTKKNSDEKVTTTYWHNLVGWGKTAELIGEYVSKGDELIIDGKITNRKWKDDNGVEKRITEIVINGFENQSKKHTKKEAPLPTEPRTEQTEE